MMFKRVIATISSIAIAKASIVPVYASASQQTLRQQAMSSEFAGPSGIEKARQLLTQMVNERQQAGDTFYDSKKNKIGLAEMLSGTAGTDGLYMQPKDTQMASIYVAMNPQSLAITVGALTWDLSTQIAARAITINPDTTAEANQLNIMRSLKLLENEVNMHFEQQASLKHGTSRDRAPASQPISHDDTVIYAMLITFTVLTIGSITVAIRSRDYGGVQFVVVCVMMPLMMSLLLFLEAKDPRR